MKKIALLLIVLLVAVATMVLFRPQTGSPISKITQVVQNITNNDDAGGSIEQPPHPLSIEALRTGEFPGSDIVVEQELDPGVNYTRAIASYKSEGLKIFGLLTIPTGEKPPTGWPIVVFNHGYIAPSEYATTERYVAYQDAFARAGYITFKSDYRGHGTSEGEPSGGYGAPGYTIDVMNATASLKKLSSADPNRIGLWGHSMGGYITLRAMVARDDVKAGVIWAGVVASYPDLLERWRRRPGQPSPFPTTSSRGGWRVGMVEQYGTPQQNPDFWNSISANTYLADISGPVQIHHGTADTSVPVEFSQELHEDLQALGKGSELYIYEGDDHNIAANLAIALQRSVEFFDTHVKGE